MSEVKDGMGLQGTVTLELFDENGDLKDSRTVPNLVTTSGDSYYANKGLPTSGGTAANGMKLGTGTTAAAKSGAGAALTGTYISGSNNTFDSSTIVGSGDTGRSIRYVTTWAAGDATNAAITEAVIVNDQGTDATSTAANTYARVVFSAINKTASDVLVATWDHTFLGA